MSYGDCEKPDCGQPGVIFLDGQKLLCWDHYCDEMASPKLAEITAGAERLRQEYLKNVSIVEAKARAKNKGVPEEET